MSERIKKAFQQYISESFFGKVINRLDLHEITFEAGYEQGAEDKRYELSKEKCPHCKLPDTGLENTNS